MAEFDAELHLRLAGERMIIDRRGDDGGSWESPLDAAAHALVAVGALAAATAQAIVDDYYLAQSARSGEDPYIRYHRRMIRHLTAAGPGGAAPGEPGRFRALSCGQLIEQPWGHLLVDYVVLSADATVLYVTMRPSAALGGRFGRINPAALGRGITPPQPAAYPISVGVPGQLTLTDDRGTSVTAGFSGGGSDTEWTGEFEARPGLARDTGWIEVLGQRIELVDEPAAGIEVWVEPVAEQHPGRRYLQARLAMLLQAHEDAPLDTTIDALVAAGALAADDPAIAEARAVARQHSWGDRHGSGGRRRLPEPWRSLLAGGSRGGGGPAGRVMVGAVTPTFDRMTVALLAVRSTAEELTADVEVSPGLPHWHAGLTMVDKPMLIWWAADDRGGYYLGQPSDWHSAPDRAGGQIEFWPALDPAATRLDIMPTTLTQRAVIRVPLSWAAAQ
ncbi:MAG TPA: hypothetical protein VGH77_15520 [Streptosporangiaceae bacterium]